MTIGLRRPGARLLAAAGLALSVTLISPATIVLNAAAAVGDAWSTSA